MIRILLSCTVILMITNAIANAQQKPPIHLWFEPEWFDGVEGSFGYWSGPAAMKATGHWGIAGPGIAAEFTQGGESEWNSMGAAPQETNARCHRDFVVPRAGSYKVWVRYYDHRKLTEPFTVTISQNGKSAITREMGVEPVVPENNEHQLYWGFAFGWASVEGKFEAGPARIELIIDKPGEAFRQVDAVLITDDLNYTPIAREKPSFAYEQSFEFQPPNGASWRGSAKNLTIGNDWSRKPLGGRDFAMWAGIDAEPKWWAEQKLDDLTLYDVFFHFSAPRDIKDQFAKQFAGQKDIPMMSWPGLLPGFYLGYQPDLSPGTPVFNWLQKTKTPFYIMTNYANPKYTDAQGVGIYQALTAPLAEQFMGFIHGEAIGSLTVSLGDQKTLPKERRAHVDALIPNVVKQQAAEWSKFFKTNVPESFWSKGISCLSCESITLAHLFHESGRPVVGYELDATNAHIPMRIAFERGAARQYGGGWLNYASGNFGDACNYFSQDPVVPRGAKSWFHSKYAVTDGVTISWYRKMYYMNFLGGASAIYWEQSLNNQWILPGPGTHPIQLSPFGRATTDFMDFVSRVDDRGEPYTPVGILLSYGHGYERVNNYCKMLNVFPENDADRELRELFNVCWYPAPVRETKPISPDLQSMPPGVYGDIFDVLVDRPSKAQAIFNYPVIWAAGDVELGGPWVDVLRDYVTRGGTLVVNIERAKTLPAELTGIKPTGKRITAEEWSPATKSESRATTPFDVEQVEVTGAKPLAIAGNAGTPIITRHAVGEGAVIVTLVPRMMGQDERAHPALPWLMNGLTQSLLPIEIVGADGSSVRGKVGYQVNRTKTGWLVSMMNHDGLDKTQHGIARVDRNAFVDVVIKTPAEVKSAKEFTSPRDLPIQNGGVTVRVHPGDVQVIGLTTQ